MFQVKLLLRSAVLMVTLALDFRRQLTLFRPFEAVRVDVGKCESGLHFLTSVVDMTS